jgi:hypothetical protein
MRDMMQESRIAVATGSGARIVAAGGGPRVFAKVSS